MYETIKGTASNVACKIIEVARRDGAKRIEKYKFKIGDKVFAMSREHVLPKNPSVDKPPFLEDGNEIAVYWSEKVGEFCDIKNAINLTSGAEYSRGRTLIAGELIIGVFSAIGALLLGGFFACRYFGDLETFKMIFGEGFGDIFGWMFGKTSFVVEILGGCIIPLLLAILAIWIFVYRIKRTWGLRVLRKKLKFQP